MKKHIGALKRISLTGHLFLLLYFAFSMESYAFIRGDINRDDKVGLPEAIYALQVAVGARDAIPSKVISVPGDFATIQEAVDAANPGDTINVAAGTYTGSILVLGKSLKLQGAGKDTTILDVAGKDIITIDAGQLITIAGFSLKNGLNGIIGKRGAVFELNDIAVLDVSGYGIWVDQNSTARMTNISVEKSGQNGIMVFRNSSATFLGNISLKSNKADGLTISENSSGLFSGTTIETSGNSARGILAALSSSLYSSKSNITALSNGQQGIMASQSSSLYYIGSNVTLQNNAQWGIEVWGGSSISLDPGNTLLSENNGKDGFFIGNSSGGYISSNNTLTIRNNTEQGLEVSENSTLESSGTITVDGNGYPGMLVTYSSSVLAISGELNILNNKEIGLSLSKTSSFLVDSNAKLTVSGTTGGPILPPYDGMGIYVGENSALSLMGDLIVENTSGNWGVGIVLVRNSVLRFQNPASMVRVRNNSGDGVYISDGSRLDSSWKKDVVIENNTKNGLVIVEGSRLSGNGIKVQDNGGRGVSADSGSSIGITNSTITGNTAGDIALSFGSRANLNRNTIGSLPITCDTSVLSRGDVRCP